MLCNDATGDAALGDPTETALLASAVPAGLDEAAERAAFPRLDALPFDAERKLMATRHARRDGSSFVLVKGAPEAVLPLCRDAAGASARVERLADAGERVLVFAARRRRPPARSRRARRPASCSACRR